MFKKCIAGVGAAAVLLAMSASSASAAIYTSQLEYRDGLVGPQAPYGTVTLNELDAYTVEVTVTLATAGSKFINTGGPHDPFLFSTTSDETVVIQNPIDTFVDGGHSVAGFNATPFGLFSDKIACCNGKNGAKAGDLPPLIFRVSNLAGMTFAGINPTVDSDGKIITTGTGEHFKSNAGGWWFSADIFDAKTGLTYNVAAKDAFGPRPIPTCTSNCGGDGQGGVPEPATWAMMILGFGGVGATLRRRRTLLA